MLARSLLFASFCVALFSLSQGSPTRSRRQVDYCSRHSFHYTRLCGPNAMPVAREAYSKLAKFCPLYESMCGSKAGLVRWDEPEEDIVENLILPPALPRGGDIKFDLPLGVSPHKHSETAQGPAGVLTPEIVARCTPDCTASCCTTTCKCANTHPKVHSMCNPPSTAELVQTCERWYAKCPMFQQISY